MSLVPPWTAQTAHEKVKMAQNLWNTTEAGKVILAYTDDTIWRNRDQFLRGHEQVHSFLVRKWEKEKRYKLKKELFTFGDDKIAVQFWYEYQNQEDQTWRRCYGIEHWTFDPSGKMRKRQMSGNEITIADNERWFHDGITDAEVDALKLGDEHH